MKWLWRSDEWMHEEYLEINLTYRKIMINATYFYYYYNYYSIIILIFALGNYLWEMYEFVRELLPNCQHLKYRQGNG